MLTFCACVRFPVVQQNRQGIFVTNTQCGTANAKIKIPYAESPEMTKVLLLKPGVGQNITTHASPIARNFFFVLSSSFPVHSSSFFPNPLNTF